MAGWSGEVAARPNEQPIKERVRPFRESPPGEEENLGEAVYVAETKTGGEEGEDSFRERGTFSGRFYVFFLRTREIKTRTRARCPEFPGVDGIYIFKFPPSAELCRSNEIFKKFARCMSLYESEH